jgi:hypothetical protein
MRRNEKRRGKSRVIGGIGNRFDLCQGALTTYDDISFSVSRLKRRYFHDGGSESRGKLWLILALRSIGLCQPQLSMSFTALSDKQYGAAEHEKRRREQKSRE